MTDGLANHEAAATEAPQGTPPDRGELDHRIANSLQIVSAFLRAKRDYDRNSADEALAKVANRIATIAHFHGYLAQQDAGQVVCFNDLLQRALGDIHADAGLQCEVGGDQIFLTPGNALSLLIVMNELAINAHHHGYESREGGRFSVHCKQHGDEILITASDSGKGLPDDFSVSGSQGFGLEIVTNTIEQLGGWVGFQKTDQGCACLMRIPVR